MKTPWELNGQEWNRYIFVSEQHREGFLLALDLKLNTLDIFAWAEHLPVAIHLKRYGNIKSTKSADDKFKEFLREVMNR